jgi:uncharacterized protein DUF3105
VRTAIRRNLLPGVALAVVVALAMFVALSACGNDGGTPPDEDSNPELPGTFVPTQGRTHFQRTFDRTFPPTPFCVGVATSESSGAPSVTPPPGEFACYASNPPTSGWHLPPQRNAEVAPGAFISIPPDPDVYPPDIEIPREAIPHILEHAGVFVGYDCADGDAACQDVVEQIERVVNDRIDNHNDRVVMARDSDLPVGTIGLAAWTRVDTFSYTEFTQDRVAGFIGTHSCRFDPEGFCR